MWDPRRRNRQRAAPAAGRFDSIENFGRHEPKSINPPKRKSATKEFKGPSKQTRTFASVREQFPRERQAKDPKRGLPAVQREGPPRTGRDSCVHREEEGPDPIWSSNVPKGIVRSRAPGDASHGPRSSTAPRTRICGVHNGPYHANSGRPT